MKLRPVNDWQRAWRWVSVHIGIVAVTLGVMPPDMQAAMLASLGIPQERLPAVLGLAFLVGRMVNQTRKGPTQ